MFEHLYPKDGVIPEGIWDQPERIAAAWVEDANWKQASLHGALAAIDPKMVWMIYNNDTAARTVQWLEQLSLCDRVPTLLFLQAHSKYVLGRTGYKSIVMLGKRGCTTVLFNADSAGGSRPLQPDQANTLWQADAANVVDVTLHPSKHHIDALATQGFFNAGYLGHGLHRAFKYRPIEKGYDICFIGNAGEHLDMGGGDSGFESRHGYILELIETFPNKRLLLVGKGWGSYAYKPNVHWIPSCTYEEAARFYNESRIVLSISNTRSMKWLSSDRLYNAFASGSDTLFERFNGYGDILPQEGMHMSFGTTDELCDLVRNRLDSENYRQQINSDRADAFQAKFAQEHFSWTARLRQMKAYVDAARGRTPPKIPKIALRTI